MKNLKVLNSNPLESPTAIRYEGQDRIVKPAQNNSKLRTQNTAKVILILLYTIS